MMGSNDRRMSNTDICNDCDAEIYDHTIGCAREIEVSEIHKIITGEEMPKSESKGKHDE